MLSLSPTALEAALCRESLFDFLQRFWDAFIPEKPVWNWHIEYLCHELQTVAERVFKRKPKLYDLIINVSPGTTKSTICSVVFPIWCWTRDPTIHTICGSYAFPLSLRLANYSLKIARSDKFRRLFPRVKLDSEAAGYITNTLGGERITTSTGGSITGMHGHIIVIDDPINPKEAVSDVGLRAAADWFDHTLMSRKIDKAITPVILIMQRLHQADPTGHLLEKKKDKKIRHIRLPATLTDKVQPKELREFYLGGLFDPTRMGRKVLEEARTDLGEYAYAGQYEQEPVPAHGGMFRVDMLRIERSLPRLRKVVRYWDKAGTEEGHGAYTVGVKMGEDTDGRFWVIDVVRGRWEAAARERTILQTAQIDGRAVWIGVEREPGSGGKESAQATVRRLAGFRVETDLPTGDKAQRADPFAVQVNEGNVRLLAAEWNREYIEELRYFPLSTYKDQVDASSGAFAKLTKRRIRVGGLRK